VIVIDKPDAVQTEIRAGHVGLAFTDPDYFASLVYNSVLGQSGSSRLYNEVRRKRGLSYGAASNFLPAYQPGWFQVSTFTKTESTAEALKVSLDVVEDLAKEPVPATELAERKTYLTGVFPMQIETPQGISSQIIQAFKYGYDRKWLETYRDKIDAVNAQQLQSFAQRRIHPDRALVVLVGNASGFKADLEKTYGPVEVIPYHDLDLARPELRKK
jgi:zinc protease